MDLAWKWADQLGTGSLICHELIALSCHPSLDHTSTRLCSVPSRLLCRSCQVGQSIEPNKKRRISYYRVSVVSPRTKLHETILLIERKELHVNVTRGLVNGGRVPSHFARIMEHSFGHNRDLVVSVGTNERKLDCYSECCFKWSKKTYLLYSTMSGNQMFWDGTYRCLTPPYSSGSHFSL